MAANNSEQQDFGQKWVGYRPEIKIVDVTVRDGGLMNDHKFGDDFVRAVYNACVEGGIDYMELGYRTAGRLASRDKYGAWKFCSEDDVRRIVGDNDTNLKLCIMADADRCDYKEDIPRKSESVIDMIRIATYIHQIPVALDMVKDAHDKGYESTVNLMAASTVPESEIRGALELICASDTDAVYVVDSFGSFYSEHVHFLTKMYLEYAAPQGKNVGMHAHNNQQLAYANTIEAAIKGANLLDSSMAGLGRGAGNCQTELLVGFLHNPRYHLRPLLKCIQDTVEPMRKDLRWGYDLPYMITGILNQHPREAMAYNEGNQTRDIVAFYDKMVGPE